MFFEEKFIISLDSLTDFLEESSVVDLVVPPGQIVRINPEWTQATLHTQSCPVGHLSPIGGRFMRCMPQVHLLEGTPILFH